MKYPIIACFLSRAVSGDKWRELEETCLRTIPAVPQLGLTTPIETTQAAGITVAAEGASIPLEVPVLTEWEKVSVTNLYIPHDI